MKLPRVILGANPFHGTSYLGAAKRAEYHQRFIDEGSIFEVMAASIEMGVRGLHCFAKDMEIRAVLKAKEKFGNDLKVIAIIPDVYGAMGRLSGGQKITHGTRLRMVLQSLPNILSLGQGDILPLLRQVLETELDVITPIKPDVVVLHGALTDLACGNELKAPLQAFYQAVEKRGAIPGLATHHLGVIYEKLQKMALKPPLLMVPVNPKGYMMSPSQERCEQIIRQEKETIFMAKKVLAGGVIPPGPALRYAFDQVGVASVSLGIGSLAEARDSFSQAKEILGSRFAEEVDVPVPARR